MMQRREFITLLGGGAVWPIAARAQPAAIPVIGWLGGETLESSRNRVAAFQEGLANAGYVEGRNVAIEYRWAEYHYDRLPALAAELVRRQAAVIFVGGSAPGALALKAATNTIPIVFLIGPDPVELGLVASLSHPGGNITGTTTINVEVIAKRLELLHALVPSAQLIAALVNPTNSAATEPEVRELRAAASTLGLRLLVVNASNTNEIDDAYAPMVTQQVGGLLVSGESFFTTQSDHVVALAARCAVPTIYSSRLYAEAGGLLSYGTDPVDGYRLAAGYTGRILKGERPGDLPVQQITKVELVINLKAAKALGLTFQPHCSPAPTRSSNDLCARKSPQPAIRRIARPISAATTRQVDAKHCPRWRGPIRATPNKLVLRRPGYLGPPPHRAGSYRAHCSLCCIRNVRCSADCGHESGYCRAAEMGQELPSAGSYSMTSSARASKVAGNSRPSPFAVVRLRVRSNLVGCSTGISPGLVPRRDGTPLDPAERIHALHEGRDKLSPGCRRAWRAGRPVAEAAPTPSAQLDLFAQPSKEARK